MSTVKEKLKNFKMPHTYVILISIMVLVLILTHIIPAGEYERVPDPNSGKNIVVADSFTYVDDVKAPGLFDLFLALEAGYVDAADIMFLIIFAYGFVFMLTKNGTMDAALGSLVKYFGNRVELLIPITMLILGIMASTMGIYEEVYGLFPVFVGIFLALGYDAVVGGAVIFLGVSIGYAAGTTNPYTIAIAQDIAEVELYSGMGFRWFIFIVTELIAIAYVMLYARRVKKNPEKSVVYGCDLDGLQVRSIDEIRAVKMNTRQILCLIEFFGVLVFLFYAILKKGWYIDEISAFFFMAMVVAGILSGYSATEICKTFIESTRSMVSSMLVVGFTRGILLLMKQGMITDTIVHGLVTVLNGGSSYMAAYGMLIIENIVKFFINGSTSAATITMPILAPTAELVGMSRSIAVLAYQLGHSFADIFWPTACALCCGLMGVPINKWYKFVTPLFAILFVMEFVFITIAVAIGY
ncbi:MAG: YfcC family protein [Lachnospiraceae bacterium]|nr:YfcC family protein [Lachnospiraceae bacterium]